MGVAMPSWNIHIAQTERLLERTGALANSVRDRNAFCLAAWFRTFLWAIWFPALPIPSRTALRTLPSPSYP